MKTKTFLAALLCFGLGIQLCTACQINNKISNEPIVANWTVVEPARQLSSNMAPYGFLEKMKNVTSPVEKRFQSFGPNKVKCLQTPCNDKKMNKITVFFPEGLESSASRWPLVIMVNGTGVGASKYASIFEHLASWGFIVAGNEDEWSGSGESTSVTLDFMLRENARKGSPFYHRIDTTNIGVAGHSQGGTGTFNAIGAMANGKRYKAAFSMSPAHKELAASLLKSDFDISKVDKPIVITASSGAEGFIHDADDGKGNRICDINDMRKEMQLIHAAHPTVPVIIARLSDNSKNHGENLMESEPYLAACFSYWLKGDKEAGKAFMGTSPEIKNNKRWQDAECIENENINSNTNMPAK